MKTLTTLAALTALLLAAPTAPLHAQQTPAPLPIGVDTLLRLETPAGLDHLRNWTSHLQSSYDRSGGNGDFGQYLAVDGTSGVMLDQDGPGAVVRLWSANPGVNIKIYIDNSPTPIVDTAFARLFDGTTTPFAPPLAQPSSGGFYSYLPIPYAKHCKIVAESPAGKPDEIKHLYYQVNYLTFPAGTNVRSFALPLTPADSAALLAAKIAWSAPASAELPAGATVQTKLVEIGAGKTEEIDSQHGNGTIRVLQTRIPEADADDTALRHLILRGYFDGHNAPDIEAPIADLFGSAYGRKPFTSLLLDQAPDGTMTLRFPMPFGRSARFTLENATTKSITFGWRAAITRDDFHPGADGYFHALWWEEKTKRGTPHFWTKLQGEHGHFVGIVQTMYGMRSFGYLEGDDQFRVDDETWGPSKVPTTVVAPWNGTGTEDCFNSGWYFNRGTNDLPLNGLLVKDQRGAISRIDVYRWFLNDAPVFQRSIDAQLEHGGVNDAPGTYYSSVAYWYSDGPAQPWSPALDASRIAPLPTPATIPDFTIPHAIEGEGLVGAAKASAGRIQTQDMSGYEGQWSHGEQLWWTGAKPADTLTLTLPAHAGTYDLTGYFTKAIDYGQVSFAVNGQPLATTVDAFHNGVIATGPVALGRVTLPDGPAQLVITITGKNAASTGYLFGLDALTLTPAK